MTYLVGRIPLLAKDNIKELFQLEEPKQNYDDGQLQLELNIF